MSIRVAVLASGRGSNLEALLNTNLEPAIIVHVISNIEQAGALQIAYQHQVSTEVISHKNFETREKFEDALLASFLNHNIELVLLAGFMRVLSPHFISAFKNRILNIHPSLLPAFRGLHAQEQAFQAGVSLAGCSVHLVDSGVDTGTILAQACVPVLSEDTKEILSHKILEAEHVLYPKVVQYFAEHIQSADKFQLLSSLEPFENSILPSGTPVMLSFHGLLRGAF